MQDPRAAVCKVFDKDPFGDGVPGFRGTAFLISSDHLLTCKHVVSDLEPAQTFLLGDGAWVGGGVRTLKQITYHPDRDIALLTLKKPADKAVYLELGDKTVNLKPADTVVLAGCTAPGRSVETPPLVITGYEGAFDLELTDKTIQKGMSGGPVLYSSIVAGVAQAREEAHALIIPVAAFAEFVFSETRIEERAQVYSQFATPSTVRDELKSILNEPAVGTSESLSIFTTATNNSLIPAINAHESVFWQLVDYLATISLRNPPSDALLRFLVLGGEHFTRHLSGPQQGAYTHWCKSLADKLDIDVSDLFLHASKQDTWRSKEPLLEGANSSSPLLDISSTAMDSVVEHIAKHSDSLSTVSEDTQLPPYTRRPRFLLFERAGKTVMAIIAEEARVDTYSLQTPNEPIANARILDSQSVEKLGFVNNRVHPLFLDPNDCVHRIFIDATLVAQAALFPDSRVAIPQYMRPPEDTSRYIASIHSLIKTLIAVHGDSKVFFSRITKKARTDELLDQLSTYRAVKTRFAPTPSSTLHIGNVRTAIVSYLFYLQHCATEYGRGSTYSLRIDNTDQARSKGHVTRKIERELDTLGIHWDHKFSQIDPDCTDAYQTVLDAMTSSGIARSDDSDELLLNSLDRSPDYYNLWFDWHLGPRIDHQAPKTTKGEEKPIYIGRAGDDPPYYRFAGIVDDMRYSTHVFRDDSQLFLTRVQSHIRFAIQKTLAANESASKAIRDAFDIDAGTGSIGLPVYIHLQRIVDEAEEKLSKRTNAQPYMLADMLNKQQLLSEGIVAYVMTTIFKRPSKTSPRDHLRTYARLLARQGNHEGLRYIAGDFTISSISKSKKPIRCWIEDIHLASRLALHHMPFHRMRQLLEQAISNGEELSSDELDDIVERICFHRRKFASWREVLDTARGPTKKGRITKESRKAFVTWLEDDSAKTHARITNSLALLEQEAQDSPNVAATRQLRTYWRDLRVVLIGQKQGPPVGCLLDILTPVIRDRIVKYIGA